MRLLLLAPFALLLASCDLDHLSDANREFEDFSYDFPLSATGRLTLDNYNGSVEITAWDQEKIEIRGSKYASTKEQLADIRVEARAVAPDQVTIRTVPPSERRGNTGARSPRPTAGFALMGSKVRAGYRLRTGPFALASIRAPSTCPLRTARLRFAVWPAR